MYQEMRCAQGKSKDAMTNCSSDHAFQVEMLDIDYQSVLHSLPIVGADPCLAQLLAQSQSVELF